MPTIEITQAEQNMLKRLLSSSLNEVNKDQQKTRQGVRDVRMLYKIPAVARRAAQRALHNRISRNNEKIAKRVALLKKIKQA